MQNQTDGQRDGRNSGPPKEVDVVDVVRHSEKFILPDGIKREHVREITVLIDLTRKIAAEKSTYRGQAIRMKFRTSQGVVDKNAQPKFMDLANVEPVIFSAPLQDEIDTNIMAPILYSD